MIHLLQKYVFALICFLYSLSSMVPLSAQNDLSKTGFSVKLYTGPQFFLQSNMSGAPMPLVGLKTGLVFNTTELEFGLVYVPKFLNPQMGTPGQHFLSIAYTHHYLIPSFHIHQKIFAKNKHIFSVSAGVGLVYALANPADTLFNNGSHRINWHPTGRQAIQLGVQLEGSVRYTYGISAHTGFFAAPFFNFKILKEYVEPNSPQGAPDPNNTYVPVTDFFSAGIMVGFHWMVPFSATKPGFFADTQFKNK